MRCHDVVSTAAYKKSLEALQSWPEATVAAEVLVAQARVRPRRGTPVDAYWRAIRSLAYGDCPSLVLLYHVDENAIILGAVLPYTTDDFTVWADDPDQEPRHDDFVAWLNAGNDDAAAHVEELLARPAERWDAWVAAHRPAFTYHLLELLAQAAFERLAQDATRAQQVVDFAIGHLMHVVIPDRYGHLLLLLNSRLWRERANALRHTATPAEALVAYERAVEVLQSFPLVTSDVAAAWRGAALVRHEMDDTTGQPLRLIHDAIAMFHETCESGELVTSYLYEGLIHFDLKCYPEAMTSFEEAHRLALLIGDEAMRAHALVNLGNCAQELHRYRDAIHYLKAAVDLFDKLGMKGERPHASWGMAWICADQHDYDTALGLFEETSAAFTCAGKPLHAADAQFDGAKILVRAGRDSAAVAAALEVITIFADAGMNPRTTEAFALLKAEAKRGHVTEEQIEQVQRMLRGEG